MKLWPLVLAAATIWFVVFSLAGIGLAVASGEHGSVIFVLLGVMSGTSGAVMCVALWVWPLFRSLPFAQRVLFMALASELLFALSCSFFLMGVSDIALVAASAALPMLLASGLVNHFIGRMREA